MFGNLVFRAALWFAALMLASCGGGGGGGGGSDPGSPSAPSGLTYPSPQSIRLNVAMSAVSPTVTGTVTSYSVSPALPAGLSLNATTGQIAGTATVAAAPAAYTVTATNAGGSTTFVVSLSVYTLEVESSSIARITAQGVPIDAQVIVRLVHFGADTVYATATDASGVLRPSVPVTDNADGTYTLRLTSNPGALPQLFAGNVILRLCRDEACTLPQDAATVSVPFSINVLGPGTAWPANNLTPLVAWPGVPDWSTVQGNAAHTGYVPITVRPDDFTLRWASLGEPLYHPWGQLKPNLVTSNGMFFVASSNYLDSGVVYGKSEFDGSEIWRFDTAGMTYPTTNPAAVANGVVYFAAGHQGETYLFARNAADGGAIFRATMSSQWETYYSPTIGPNGTIYTNAGTYGGLYGFNPAGDQLFFSNQAQMTNWSPAVDAAGVYAYTGDRLQMVDPVTGAVVVTIQDPAYQNYVYDVGGAPVLGNAALGSVFAAGYTNSMLNAGTLGNMLTNFRTVTGTIAWQVPGVYPTTPAYRDGVVYAVNQNPLRLEARAESDGALLWSWTPEYAGETSFVSEVLLTNSHAFVSTNYATHAIDLATRRSVWSFPASGKVALSANGVGYIHSGGVIVAINLK